MYWPAAANTSRMISGALRATPSPKSQWPPSAGEHGVRIRAPNTSFQKPLGLRPASLRLTTSSAGRSRAQNTEPAPPSRLRVRHVHCTRFASTGTALLTSIWPQGAQNEANQPGAGSLRRETGTQRRPTRRVVSLAGATRPYPHDRPVSERWREQRRQRDVEVGVEPVRDGGRYAGRARRRLAHGRAVPHGATDLRDCRLGESRRRAGNVTVHLRAQCECVRHGAPRRQLQTQKPRAPPRSPHQLIERVSFLPPHQPSEESGASSG